MRIRVEDLTRLKKRAEHQELSLAETLSRLLDAQEAEAHEAYVKEVAVWEAADRTA